MTAAWTQEQFFAWDGHEDGRYEFDGVQPEAMADATVNHAAIAVNILLALRSRLRGSACLPLGSGAGLETIGRAVRYPDGLVTCSKQVGTSFLIAGPVVVFEVLSSSSGRIDRIVKVREYAAVESIRSYIIVESAFAGLTLLERSSGDEPWLATSLTNGDILALPPIGIEIPVDEFYEDVAFDAA